jgi:alkanesulfonate monooxygenase SsuD/methylene tetrahydromethanopterin reductase-like flavin-dependent oxidoreductase (luciferase family)
MIDYGRPLQFGYFLNPSAERTDDSIAAARVADELGLDLIGIQDHPYQPRFLDTWTFMTWLAAETERIRLFPDVATLALRSPAMLAKAATSLDRLSGGRFELGIGIGAFPNGISAIGGEPRPPGQAIEALEEGVAVIRAMWSGDRRARFDGAYYHLGAGVAGPVPAHPIQIWIGAYKPRILGLTGRIGDGWVPTLTYAGPTELAAMHARIDEAARGADRDPAVIARIYNVMGQITDGGVSGLLNGPAEHWVETLTSFAVDYGMDGFVFGPAGSPPEQLRRFALDVVPNVRDRVAATRRERGTQVTARDRVVED